MNAFSSVIGCFLNPQVLKHIVYDAVMKNAGKKQVLVSLHLGKESTLATAIRALCEKHHGGRQLSQENLSTGANEAQVNPLGKSLMYAYTYTLYLGGDMRRKSPAEKLGEAV